MGTVPPSRSRLAPSGSDGAKLAPKPIFAGSPPIQQILICPELFRAEGGIARISRLYLQALCEIRSAPLRLIVLNDRTLPSTALRRYGGQRLVLAEPCGASKWKFTKALMQASRAGTHVLSTHVHLLPTVWLARLAHPRLQYSVVAHGLEVWQPLTAITVRALLGAQRVFCVSENTRGRMLERYPQLAARLRVVPNALDPAFPIIDCTPATEPGVILSVSRLAEHDREKGIDHLIKAMPAILRLEPGATLRIVGQGPDRSRLEDLAAASTARERITFLGYVDEAILRKEFARCQLFALPSRKEGFGLVFLEALAHGKPCIGANVGGIPEVIDPTCGMLTKYGDVPALASACVSALHRSWDVPSLLARARRFSYPAFRTCLQEML